MPGTGFAGFDRQRDNVPEFTPGSRILRSLDAGLR
jgi:hypothetical protein